MPSVHRSVMTTGPQCLADEPRGTPAINAVTHARGRSRLYSHGEYRHCTAVTSSLTTGPGEGSAAVAGCGEGTGSAVTTGRGVGTGTAASACRGECAGTVALTFQQFFIVMQN